MHPAPLHPAPMHPAPIRAAESSGAGPYTLLLAVFLVLLAMFVLLSTVSHRQQNRVAAALGSLDRSFTAAAPTGTGDRLEGIPDGALRRLAELAGVGSGTLRIGVVEPNRLVVLTTGADDLFERDGTAVAAARTALIDRIVEALRDPPPGGSVTCDALVGLGSGPAMADSDGLAAARAAALARTLISQGAPPPRLAVGLEHGRPGQVRFVFAIRPSGSGDAR